MIGPGSDAKVLIYTKPIDFRCGIDTLVAKVQHELSQDPWRGVAYIFRSKRKDRLKILWFDGTGIWLMTKRAEAAEGFAWPPAVDGSFRSRRRRWQHSPRAWTGVGTARQGA